MMAVAWLFATNLPLTHHCIYHGGGGRPIINVVESLVKLYPTDRRMSWYHGQCNVTRQGEGIVGVLAIESTVSD